MIPQVVRVRVDDRQGRRVRLWIPLIPVFIVLSPLLGLALIVGAVACLVVRVNPWRALRVIAHAWCSLCGTQIEVDQTDARVLVDVW